MSAHVSISVLIQAEPAQIWDQLSCIEDHVEWMADAERIDFHDDQRRGIGTTFSCRTKIGPFRTTDVMTIDAWDEGRCIGVTHRGAVTGTGRFQLSELDPRRTRVTWDEDLTFPFWMGGQLGARCATPIFRWIWRRNLDRLKARIEGETTTSRQR